MKSFVLLVIAITYVAAFDVKCKHRKKDIACWTMIAKNEIFAKAYPKNFEVPTDFQFIIGDFEGKNLSNKSAEELQLVILEEAFKLEVLKYVKDIPENRDERHRLQEELQVILHSSTM